MAPLRKMHQLEVERVWQTKEEGGAYTQGNLFDLT